MAKILVVDDDQDFVNAVRMVLEKEGHTVISAASGSAGYQRVQEDQPDLVILDVMMDTVLDGLFMSRRMYEDTATFNIPIVMVTSIASSSYAELFPTDEYLHVRAFMSKPISPAELIKQVNKFLPKP